MLRRVFSAGAVLAVLLVAAAGGRSHAADSTAWPVRGNVRSRIYFWQGCPNYREVAERRRMEFPSACAAEAAGFRAAGNCRGVQIPPGHRGGCKEPPSEQSQLAPIRDNDKDGR